MRIVALAAAVAAVVVTGAGAAERAHAADEPIVLKFSSGQLPSNPKVIAAMRLLDLIEERTGGRVDFDVFHSAQLFRDSDEPNAIRQGQVDMTVTALVFMDSIVPDTQIYGLPLTWGVDPNKTKALAASEIGKEIESKIEDRLGVKVLGSWLTGTTMYATNVPVKSVEDFAGLRIRVAGSKLWEEYTRALGASPISMAPAEMITAAQQGVIDGIDGNANTFVGQKIWQVLKYGIRTNHTTIVHAVMVNGDKWETIPADLQAEIEKAAAELQDWEWDYAIGLLDDSYKTLAENGMEIYTPSPEVLAEIRSRIVPLQEPYVANSRMDPTLVERAEAFLQTL